MAVESCATKLATDTDASSKTTNKVFLFVGPSGVGKTELAKSVGKIKSYMITLNMNQYVSEHDYSLIFGAPPELKGCSAKPHCCS